MKGWESFGLGLVLLVLVGTPAAVFAGQKYLNSPTHTYTLVGYAVEDGGWTPRSITVQQGEHARLRLTSADVSHGLMVPGLDISVPEIYPGKFTTVDFIPSAPGIYPFTCSLLCSPRHNEMQGFIVVLPAESIGEPAGTPPMGASAEAASGASLGTDSAGRVAAGKRVYQTFCLSCHGPNAAGGLKLGAVSSDIRSGALDAAFHGDRALIRRAILNGKDPSGKDLNVAMPRWQGQLRDAQVSAVIDYLEHGT
ncbi:MAG: c-type cytochrome [Chloroflexota bacterium]|nr:c-type cytochrome [Chloroflexota bacterium]